ncbi:MAG: ABC transporter ATP-binding protein [Deltaproteobacteria bacterium]|nr:ABC transporter ATP-binding protein [Deltaproteobacteria bacterium]
MNPTLRLIGYIRLLPGQYAMGIVLTLGYALLFQVIPLAVRKIVAAIESGRGLPAVQAAVLNLVFIAAVFALVRLASRMVMFRAAREIEYQIRNDFFLHLQRLPQSFFNTKQTGDIMSRAVNDINNIRLFLGMGLLNIIQTPILYLGSIFVMLSIDARITLWVLSPFLLFILIARWFSQRIFRASLAAQEQLGRVSAAVQENASGVLVVRSYSIEEQEKKRFERQNQKLYEKAMMVVKVGALMQSSLALLPVFAMMVVLFKGGHAVQEGRLDAADLWVFYVYITLLTFPTVLLGFVVMMIQRGFASLRRIGEIFDTIPSIQDRPDAVSNDKIRGAVRFDSLSFAYPGFEQSPALNRLCLEVDAGQTVGIVGVVGSGKSTLVSTVPRLVEVSDATVFIDGIDVNLLPLRLLRSSVAMVPQDSFLFSTTVAENIRFGVPDATPEQIHEAARRAQVFDEIMELQDGFETVVGERGITLSGGQRQRIALARALLLKPAILILDDSLSSVDYITEEKILKELKVLALGRTCLIVAHRLSAVREADKIVVMSRGSIVEQGTHNELVAINGLYSALYRQQQLEKELDSEQRA